MPPLTLLINPVSSSCNLRCQYCFYHCLSADRVNSDMGPLSSQLLELLVQRAFEYADGHCLFTFQGGEPTLAGLEFYHQLLKFQTKYNTKRIPVRNVIQTNGLLIDEEWAAFLSQRQFLVGLSLDGPKEIHDRYRLDPLEKGTFSRVMQTVRLFQKYKVEFTILTVATNWTALHPVEIYHFFKQYDLRYLRFIPCLDSLKADSVNQPYSLLPENYSQFLKTLFDLWFQDVIQNRIISIRLFEEYLEMILGHPPKSCGRAGECSGYFLVEGNGTVYPCNFYVSDEWVLGNITRHSFVELRQTATAQKFLADSRMVPVSCRACQWYFLCRNGCRRRREPLGDGTTRPNDYCEVYQEFFKYSWDKFRVLAQMLRQANRR